MEVPCPVEVRWRSDAIRLALLIAGARQCSRLLAAAVSSGRCSANGGRVHRAPALRRTGHVACTGATSHLPHVISHVKLIFASR